MKHINSTQIEHQLHVLYPVNIQLRQHMAQINPTMPELIWFLSNTGPDSKVDVGNLGLTRFLANPGGPTLAPWNLLYVEHHIYFLGTTPPVTDHFPFFARHHLLHGLEADDGMFDPEEERLLPVDGTRHWRLVLVKWRIAEMLLEKAVHHIHLEPQKGPSF